MLRKIRVSGLPLAVVLAGTLVGAVGAVIVFGPEGASYRVGAAVAAVGLALG